MTMTLDNIQQKVDQIKESLKCAEQEGDVAKQLALMQEYLDLQRMLKE